MQNRPASSFYEGSEPTSLTAELSFDRNPIVRLVALFVLLVLPFVVVAGKLGHLQSVEADEFVLGLEPKFDESFESIPTTDGRILMDSTVMARDVATYRLKMHYRWLEEPADEQWLKRKALARLSKAERKDKDKVAAAKEQIQEERRRMWDRLTTTIGISAEDFAVTRAEIKKRVEIIVSRVETRTEERRTGAEIERQRELDEHAAGQRWWERTATLVKHELTTPPRRPKIEPVVVREELAYHLIAEDVAFERIADVITQTSLYPGLDFEVTTRREYPQGALAGHLIGLRKVPETSDEDVPAEASEEFVKREIQPGDRAGQDGLEAQYDRWLKGRRGLRRVLRNGDGEIVQRETVREPMPGSDVQLALIEALQRRVEKMLDEATGTHPLEWNPEGEFVANATRNVGVDGSLDRADESTAHQATGGCIIALNVATGEVIAAACAPRFDLRVLVDYQDDLYQRLLHDPRRPMFPRVTQMALPPGSVFKTMTAIAGLEEGKIDPNVAIHCRGYYDTPDKHRCYIFKHLNMGHGDTKLSDALCRSCNVYFFDVALKVGPQRLSHWCQSLGFGSPTGIDVPGEASGNVPASSIGEFIQLASYQEGETAHRLTNGAGTKLSRSDTMGFGIGQASLTVTPLQIARLMATVGNGGDLVTPRLVREIVPRGSPRTSSANALERPELPPAQRQSAVLSARTIHFVRAGLEQVVASPRGTGFGHVRMKEVTIAGKTGTAETGSSRADHAWFAGYVPADRPQIAFVVALENGGKGASAAGPLARELVREMLALGVIAPGRLEPAK